MITWAVFQNAAVHAAPRGGPADETPGRSGRCPVPRGEETLISIDLSQLLAFH